MLLNLMSKIRNRRNFPISLQSQGAKNVYHSRNNWRSSVTESVSVTFLNMSSALEVSARRLCKTVKGCLSISAKRGIAFAI
jgi:hypothetical protein